MTEKPVAKGPWTHRLLIGFFALLFGLLVFWLLGFVLRDIGTWPGPSYEEVERQMLDRDLSAEATALEARAAEVTRDIAAQKERQAILRESTAASQQTMNQLLDFQRLRLQQNEALSNDEQQALADAQKLFLDNQRQYQQLNEDVARLSAEARRLDDQRRDLNERLSAARGPINARFTELQERHDLKVAAVKLAVLLPLVLVSVYFFVKGRKSLYAPLINAFGLAVLVRVGLVMHEYFPTRYFKYVLILVSIAVVAWVLVYLLRAVAYPRRDWLLKRYREAYERFACPVCDYPVRRGPLRYLLWTRRSLKKIATMTDPSAATDDPYTCPSCGTRLFEECEASHGTRHSLLPACEKCGTERPIAGAEAK